MKTKSEQILESVRELRQAKIELLRDNQSDGKMFSNVAKYQRLAVNKMDQLCEALELTVKTLETIRNNDACAEYEANAALLETVEILGRDK